MKPTKKQLAAMEREFDDLIIDFMVEMRAAKKDSINLIKDADVTHPELEDLQYFREQANISIITTVGKRLDSLKTEHDILFKVNDILGNHL